VGAGKAVFPAGSNIPAEVATATDSEGARFPVLKKCTTAEPALREVMPGHWAACHVTENYDSAPVSIPQSDHRREVVPTVVEGDALLT
jgi:hypothetical protein